jgi:DNA-binding transcriptional LysR family regulator
MNASHSLIRARLMITFARIVEFGSITAAASQMGLDKAAVSRQLRDLEEHLGVRLMHRSTRQMTLTEAGQAVAARGRRVLDEVESASTEAEAFRSTVSGVLTVTASVAFGKLHVVPLMAAFMELYPAIEVHLCLLDRQVDPVEEGVDVLLRLCDEPPPNFVAHHLSSIQYAVVAAPALLRRSSPLTGPTDLADQPCLFYGFKARHATWHFLRDGRKLAVDVATRLSVNSSEAVRDLAVQGLGYALLPSFAISQDLHEGRLTRVLPAWTVEGNLGRSLYAIHLPGRYASPKVRAFVKFVAQHWSGSAAPG